MDSVYALEGVACRARAHANHALVSLARSVALRIRATSQVAFERVSAHGGEPGNELADILADIGMCGLGFTPGLGAWVAQAISVPAPPPTCQTPRLLLDSLIYWSRVLLQPDPKDAAWREQ